MDTGAGDISQLAQNATSDPTNISNSESVTTEETKSQSIANPSINTTVNAQNHERERSRSPQVTDALEALLGGLGSASLPQGLQVPEINASTAVEPAATPVSAGVSTAQHVLISQPVDALRAEAEAPNVNDTITAQSLTVGSKGAVEVPSTLSGAGENATFIQNPVSGGVTINAEHLLSANTEVSQTRPHDGDVEMSESTKGEESPLPTQAPTGPSTHEMIDVPATNNTENGAEEGEHPEWEVDSSPIESSSDDSSDDSSSEEDSDDEENAYKLLSPEEQARILMADAGSDDEGEGKKKGASGPGAGVKSKNEMAEVVISKPDVTITAEMSIVNLGVVETIVQNIALIKGRTSGEYQVLESGSVLCLEDRTVIGVVAEPLGRVQQPLYSVMFTNAEDLAAAGLSVGTVIFYSEQHAKYVFTQALKAFKGSDASNIHDEEVGDDEMEFSDDEAELAHRQKVNAAKRGAKTRGGRADRGGHPLQQQHSAAATLDYDEVEDGPYKPLARPARLAQSIGHGEAPQESGSFGSGGQHRGNSRGGRGDRGRGRGDRGRGRGGFNNRGGHGNSYSQNGPAPSMQDRPQPQNNANYGNNGFSVPQIPNFYNMPQPYSPNQNYGQPPPWPPFPTQPHQQQNQHQSQQPQQPFQQPGFHQAYRNMQQQANQNQWPPMPLMPPLPHGGHFNPAFFGNQPGNPNQWNQQGGNNSNGQNR